jgi:double-stranded uracil-DNA glycosylase
MPLDNSRPVRSRRSTLRLRDVIRPGVRVLFVGINPGLRSAAVGHHFAGHSNRFWKLLSESQLVSEPIDWSGDVRLPEWGFGITNLVGRATAGISELRPSDFQGGRRTLLARIQRFHPEIVALVGVTLFRSLFPNADFHGLGLQIERLGSAQVFVLPNPSGRNANFSYQEMLEAFRALKTTLSLKHRSAVK